MNFQEPVTEIEIAEAIRNSDPGVQAVIRRLAFERDMRMNLPERLWDLHKPEGDVSFALFFAMSRLSTTPGYAHLTPDEVYEKFKKLYVEWKAQIRKKT